MGWIGGYCIVIEECSKKESGTRVEAEATSLQA